MTRALTILIAVGFASTSALSSPLSLWLARGTQDVSVQRGLEAASTLGCDALTSSRQAALNTLIKGMRTAGIWDKMDLYYVLAQSNACTATINWRNPGTNTLVQYGTIDFTPDNGFIGDCSTGYFDTGINASSLGNYVQDSGHLHAWVLNTDATTTNRDIGLAAGVNLLFDAASPTAFNGRVNAAANVSFTPALLDGLSAADRISSTQVALFQEGTQVSGSPFTAASVAVQASKVHLFDANGIKACNTVATVGIGSALTTNQEATLRSLEAVYLAHVGAIQSPVIISDELTGLNYFTPAMINSVSPAGLNVIRQGLAPASDAITESTYTRFPLSTAQAQDMQASAASTWSGKIDHFVWGFHGTTVNLIENPIFPRPHLTDGTECRVKYSTITKAEAALKTYALYSAGAAAHGGTGYLDAANAGGFADGDVLDFTAIDTGAEADALCTDTSTDVANARFKLVTDKVILPSGRLADVGASRRGCITVDAEFHDGRTNVDSEMIDLADALAALGYCMRIYTNPLDGALSPQNGWTQANLYLILPHVESFSILIIATNPSHNVATSFANQVAMFTGPLHDQPIDYSKLSITFALGNRGTTITDAQTIHDLIVTHGIPAVTFFAGGAQVGGNGCRWTNQKISTLLGLAVSC